MRDVNLRLDVFEGPMDLLIHLIEKNEIDLYDIPIAELTDQYIEYINLFPHVDMDSMSEFILMASTLLEIKSKMLLPQAAVQEKEAIDPRDELVTRLIEYKRFKSVLDYFHQKQARAEKSYFKGVDVTIDCLRDYREETDLDELLSGITIDMLYAAFQETLNRRELKTDKLRSSFNSVSKDLYTIEEKMEHIENLLTLYSEISFHKIFSTRSGKMEKVVTFLALLEMIKIKKVMIEQSSIFEEIIIRKWKDRYENQQG